ncbi:MAG: TIGR00730 family Rossman fold protein [Anaerovoracaceae bacterium]
MNIAVFCGSHQGSDPAFQKAARELGGWIGRSGHRLIYGGSQDGLMGVTARAVLAAGGLVTGILPHCLCGRETAFEEISELITVPTMAQRKEAMIRRADAFVVLPGGLGTLEECADVLALQHLEDGVGPLIFFNVHHYYDAMKVLLAQMNREQFTLPAEPVEPMFAVSMTEIAARLEAPEEEIAAAVAEPYRERQTAAPFWPAAAQQACLAVE